MSDTKRILSVVNPRTGQPDYEIEAASPQQVASEARRLRAAQPGWQARGMAGRSAALNGLADALERHRDAVARALEIDTGRRRLARSEVDG
ncbi:MAG: aldehyde dehydrogenase family protein, partial [Pseudomonadota bacterium]